GNVVASTSPYVVGQTSTVIAGQTSPYSSTVCNPCNSCNTCATSGPLSIPTAGITTPCIPGGMVVSESPTLRDKVHGLFAGRTTPAFATEQSPIVYGYEKKARPPESTLAISGP